MRIDDEDRKRVEELARRLDYDLAYVPPEAVQMRRSKMLVWMYCAYRLGYERGKRGDAR